MTTAYKLANILQWLCVACAMWFIIAFLYIAGNSLNYPFNLEWMEGQNIDVIQRIVSGLPVYDKPSIDYVPFIYTPLYYYVSAALASLTGVDFLPARLVSLLSALGIGFILYQWIKKENGCWKAATIGSGLFFATYRLSGRWFDNARVDSLFLFLTFTAAYTYFHYRGKKAEILAGVLFSAAFFTKQSALIIALPLLAGGIVFDRKHALPTTASFIGFTAIAVIFWNWISDGWFGFFVFTLPSGHGLWKHMIWNFWSKDIAQPLGILCAIMIYFIAISKQQERTRNWNYGLFALGCIGAAYVARIHSFGYINVLMSAHALFALIAGLSFKAILSDKNTRKILLITSATLIQMSMLLYSPNPFIPSEKSIETGNHFLEEISKIDGDVFMPELQFVQTRAGKKSYTLGMAAYDLTRSNLGEKNSIKNDFNKELEQAIASGRFSAIMPGRLLKIQNYKQYYELSAHLHYPQEYVTGAINFLRTDIFMRIPNTEQPTR